MAIRIIQIRMEDFSDEDGDCAQWCDTAFDPTRNLAKLNKIFGREYRLIEVVAEAALTTLDNIMLGDPDEYDDSGGTTTCEWCGPACQSGAAHNARVEDGARWND